MSASNDFSEISVLIPGYSIEDLPTDLPEEGAASLLNAVACAWHPRLLQRSASIPLFRQAESLSGYPGRRIILVPQPSESWMPHEWRPVLRDQGHIVIAGCTSRDEWLDAIESALREDEAGTTPDSPTENAAPISFDSDSNLADHFLSFGTVLLQTQLLSRRRHHFVDPDNILLGRESRLAAEAFLNGDAVAARAHLAHCFEHLRETRERFYPMNCYLVDICIPGDDEELAAIHKLLQSKNKLNLFATGQDLTNWTGKDTTLSANLRNAVTSGLLCLLTGNDVETRTSLGSMATTVDDIERCRAHVNEITGSFPRHWARRRFGLTASLPAILHHFGFESALHVALDDGLYPDRERSQFDWQAPDGSIIAAASRIPLAIDSASGFLRFADRYNESMQDDTTAALFLARLPTLKSPWLTDLQIAASYAPVLGEFATMEQLCHAANGSRLAELHHHSDYLSPFLIQSSVLKSEPPISGPASLRMLNQRLVSLRNLLGIAGIIKAGDSAQSANAALTEIDTAIAKLESSHVDVSDTSSQHTDKLLRTAIDLHRQLDACESVLSAAVQSKVPARQSNSRGLFLINALPFARYARIEWPEGWNRPAKAGVIELSQRTDNRERLLVKMPPGGFAWLSECEAGQPSQPVMEPIRGELPLAEPLKLRNRHFEVTVSDRTGGISSVSWHHQRGNRLSQQSCFRYEREQVLPDDGSGEVHKVAYATSRMVGQRVIEAGMVFASIETVTELLSPVDGTTLATVHQITSVDRVQPRIHILLRFENVSTKVKGNPWLTYYGCRFAWDNESAAITRAVLGQVCGFRSERFESPDYVEVSDSEHRVVVATHGRPYHRRSGPRMLDSMLIVEGESAREFEFTIEFDQKFPLRTAVDVLTPMCVQQTVSGVPATMASSWVLGLSAKNIELVQTKHVPASPDQSEELILTLTETDGMAVECLIKTARPPVSAFVVNANRTEKISLRISDQGVSVPFGPFQIKGILLVF